MNQDKNIVYIIPYDGIGGVETAARTLKDGVYDKIRISKHYLVDSFEKKASSKFKSQNDPRIYFRAIFELWEKKPHVVIASLWRSCAVLIFYKILRPKTRVVTFLHFPKSVHWFDWIANMLAMNLSQEIWADSQTTLDSRVPKRLLERGRIISFLVHRVRLQCNHRLANPSFVFWGRLHPQKGLMHALRIFASIHDEVHGAIFRIIGPDCGEQAALVEEVARLGLQASVHFLGPMTQDEIFRLAVDSTFYLQMSKNEGMAMSVVEAMQLGLVPVVTPVGEIKNYTVQGINAIVIKDDETAFKEIMCIIKNDSKHQSMRQEAIKTWSSAPIYSESVLAACESILKEGNFK
jgi:glycosyltransferase involved in cell wall biosynthesis